MDKRHLYSFEYGTWYINGNNFIRDKFLEEQGKIIEIDRGVIEKARSEFNFEYYERIWVDKCGNKVWDGFGL